MLTDWETLFAAVPVVERPAPERLAPIWRMHAAHGSTPGARCADCAFFIEGIYHRVTYFKCEKFGLTHGARTDWRKKHPACGLFRTSEGE